MRFPQGTVGGVASHPSREEESNGNKKETLSFSLRWWLFQVDHTSLPWHLEVTHYYGDTGSRWTTASPNVRWLQNLSVHVFVWVCVFEALHRTRVVPQHPVHLGGLSYQVHGIQELSLSWLPCVLYFFVLPSTFWAPKNSYWMNKLRNFRQISERITWL